MEWFHSRRNRGPEWKQGWRGETMASLSLPPLPLLAIFGIVVFLLSIMSPSTNYKEQLNHATTTDLKSVQFFLLPILLLLLILFLNRGHGFSGGPSWFNFWTPKKTRLQGLSTSINHSGGFPWGIAFLLVVLLVLLSYQSSFQSRWFTPLRSSD